MPPLRYAILRHEGITEPHFDLMFETFPGSALATWRSPVWPVVSNTVVTRLRDHRRDFLKYEGDLSGGRGSVHQIEAGTCEVVIEENAEWRIRILENNAGRLFVLRVVNGDEWEAEPAALD